MEWESREAHRYVCTVWHRKDSGSRQHKPYYIHLCINTFVCCNKLWFNFMKHLIPLSAHSLRSNKSFDGRTKNTIGASSNSNSNNANKQFSNTSLSLINIALHMLRRHKIHNKLRAETRTTIHKWNDNNGLLRHNINWPKYILSLNVSDAKCESQFMNDDPSRK